MAATQKPAVKLSAFPQEIAPLLNEFNGSVDATGAGSQITLVSARANGVKNTTASVYSIATQPGQAVTFAADASSATLKLYDNGTLVATAAGTTPLTATPTQSSSWKLVVDRGNLNASTQLRLLTSWASTTVGSLGLTTAVTDQLGASDLLDPLTPGQRKRDYTLNLGGTAGTPVAVTVASSGFTPKLEVINVANGQAVATASGTTTATTSFTPVSGVNYAVRVVAASGTTGSFIVSAGKSSSTAAATAAATTVQPTFVVPTAQYTGQGDTAAGTAGSNTVNFTYKQLNGSLYGATGTLQTTDINQGRIGDCYFLASLDALAVAAQYGGPNSIAAQRLANFAVANNDATATTVNTDTVNFYVNGNLTPIQVYQTMAQTQDPNNGIYTSYMATRGGLSQGYNATVVGTDGFTYSYDSRYLTADDGNSIIGSIAEKAYAGLQQALTGTPGFTAIGNGGWSTLGTLTGLPDVYLDFANTPFSTYQQLLNAGDPIWLGSSGNLQNIIVGGHAFAMTRAYTDAAGVQRIEVQNPWGVAGGSIANNPDNGRINISFAQFQQAFNTAATLDLSGGGGSTSQGALVASAQRAAAIASSKAAAASTAAFAAPKTASPNLAFDANYYLANNADVAAAVKAGKTTALQHWQTTGWKEGRNPDALFNTSYYLSKNADVKAAGVNPLDHFNSLGAAEQRDPSALFDTKAYLQNNTDVAAAVNSRSVTAFGQFLAFGVAEGRSPSAAFSQKFNAAAYLAANPDVSAAVAKGTIKSALQHYILFGAGESRSGALSGSAAATAAAFQATLSGRVLAAGPVSGATVFIDLAGTGKFQAGDPTATTDANGRFTIAAGSGPLVVTGGTDTLTKKAVSFTMKAPLGSTVISPISTLIQQQVDAGQTLAVATQSIQKNLGLPSSINLLTFDAKAAVDNKATDPATAMLGAKVAAADAQIATTIGVTTTLLTSATKKAAAATTAASLAPGQARLTDATTPLSSDDASAAAAASLGDLLSSLPDSGGDTNSNALTNSALAVDAIQDSASSLPDGDTPTGLDTVVADAASVGSVITNINDQTETAVDSATDPTAALAAAAAGESQADNAATAVDSAASGSGDFSSVDNSFSGSALAAGFNSDESSAMSTDLSLGTGGDSDTGSTSDTSGGSDTGGSSASGSSTDITTTAARLAAAIRPGSLSPGAAALAAPSAVAMAQLTAGLDPNARRYVPVVDGMR